MEVEILQGQRWNGIFSLDVISGLIVTSYQQRATVQGVFSDILNRSYGTTLDNSSVHKSIHAHSNLFLQPGDLITYTLIPGMPEGDTVIGSTYQFNPSVQTIGTHVAQIKASDPAGNFSILPLKITVDSTSGVPSSEYSVIYNGNGNTGGAVPIDSNNYTANATVTLKGNTGILVKTGAAFAGWNTAADGSGTAYAVGTTLSIGSSNTILYARWTPKSIFTVTYNGNANTAGAAPVDTGKYDIETAVTVKDNTGNMAKTGCTFAGWNTVANGSGTSYALGATFAMGSANVTLYAQWTLKPTFTVTYIGNGNTGGTVPADTTRYETSATVSVKSTTGSLVRTGFTFTGWNTAADGSGTAYAVGTTFQMFSADIKLYAQWTVDSFTVSFNTRLGHTYDLLRWA